MSLIINAVCCINILVNVSTLVTSCFKGEDKGLIQLLKHRHSRVLPKDHVGMLMLVYLTVYQCSYRPERYTLTKVLVDPKIASP